MHSLVKGTVPQDLGFQVFYMYQFPPSPDFTMRVISNFFENSWRYSQLKVHHHAVSLTPVANGKNLQSEKFLLFLLDTFG
jgi:hypothetical protein